MRPVRRRVQLLAWQVEQADFLDDDNPGIAVDTPARRQMNDLASRLEPRRRPLNYLYPSAAAFMADYRRREATWLTALLGFGGPGLYREAAEALRPRMDHFTRTGPLASRYRCCMAPSGGSISFSASSMSPPRSKPKANCSWPESSPTRTPRCSSTAWPPFAPGSSTTTSPDTLAFFDRGIAGAARADLRWVTGSSRVGRAFCLTALGRQHDGLAELARQPSP